METCFYIFSISDHTIKAICWTLFHSLWIGLIIAALAGTVITSAKKSSSHLRFNLLCGLLTLFIGLTAYTFFKQMNIAPPVSIVATGTEETGSAGFEQVQSAGTTTGITTGYNRFVYALNAASGWIVAVWMLCFIFKSIQLTREIIYIRRVRKKGIIEMDDEWKDRVAELGRQLGISRMVGVFESTLVNIPVTIGHLKPVILLPAGMILQLPAAQVESILYHELAHILRRDYLVNILISIAESVFFFNPATRWLCALIREERETCCDDIVLANISQKRSYLEALMAFQNQESQAGAYAMGLSWRPPQLMYRLRRMVNQENQRLNTMEKIVLLLGLLLFSIVVFVPKASSEVSHGIAYIKKQVQAIVNNRVEEEPVAAITNKPPVKPVHRKTIVNDTLLTTSVRADTPIVIKSMLFKDTNGDTSNMDMRIIDDKGNHYHLKVVADKLVALNINDSEIAGEDLPQHEALFRYIVQAWATMRQKKRAHGAANRQIAEERASQIALLKSTSGKKMRGDQLTEETAVRPEFSKGKRKYVPAVPDTSVTSAGTKSVAQKKRHKPIDISNDQQRVRGVLSALVSENIVPDDSKVDWFGLSETELIVNGIKQPEALHQKLKTQYGIRPQFGLYYGPAKMSGSGIWLGKEDL